MDINHNKVVYSHKGEHDDPHELPQQQYSEGSTEIKHTLYSHTANSPSEIDSFQKLEYIYQHFQDSEKIYESDPDTVMQVPDNTLYPHNSNVITDNFHHLLMKFHSYVQTHFYIPNDKN